MGKNAAKQDPPISLKDDNVIDTKFCLVGFSFFPLRGEILQDVLIELGMKHIMVKEISCWKYLFSF